MHSTSPRIDVFTVAFRNYWWSSCLGGLYFVIGFIMWGGTRAAVASSGLFVVAAAIGLAVHYRGNWTTRAPKVAMILGNLLTGQIILVWQQRYLPLSDYTASGDSSVRDFLIYLVSSLIVGTMSMFGGAWGAVLGLSTHYAFIFNSQEEFAAFRVGGDEFISLHLDALDGDGLVARVRHACASVSAGWIRCERLTLDQALTQADSALYSNKVHRKQNATKSARVSVARTD